MSRPLKSTLLIPVLNEIEGMRAIMPRVRPEWVDQIIIVDGGSTDGTVAWARSQGYFVHCQRRAGIRAAYLEALPHVRGDVIVTFSPDGNCIPERIPDLLAAMAEGCDMVIGSRYLGGARSDDDDALTAFGNWLFTKTTNLLHRARYTDVMGIFRAYRTELIRSLELDRPEPYALPERLFRTRISWEPLLSVRAAKRRLKVAEIPAHEPARIGGERKLQPFRWGGAYYFQILREVFAWR